ncbi:MAG TPA: hypothetical protein VF764_13315 [Steroidobacteraceae bacterium]
MSVPASLMRQMIAQQGKPQPGAPGAPPGAAPGGAPAPGAPASDAARTMPPAAAPFSTPQEKRGQRASALSHVHIALTLLQQALPDLGGETPEGLAVVKAMNGLAKVVGRQDNSDLVPAEVMAMVRQMPQMGGGTPVQQELMRQMMAGRGGGPGGPPGAPPGGPPAPPPQQPGA